LDKSCYIQSEFVVGIFMRTIKITALVVLILGLCYLGYKVLSSKSANTPAIGAGFDENAYFNALRDEFYILPGQEALDVDALIKIVPENVAINFDNVKFDTASGATVVSGVKITMADNADIGMEIESLSLWGVDGEALSARLSGERLEETLPIAQRIEASELSMFGLETLFAPLIDAANEMSSDMVEGMVAGDDKILTESMPVQSLDKYDFHMRKLILSDLVLHSWEIDLRDLPEQTITTGNDFDDIFYNKSNEEFWHGFQKMAAAYHAVSFGNFAAYGAEFDFEMSQDGAPMIMSFNNDYLGYKNYHRGNLEYGVVHGTNFIMDMSIPTGLGTDDQEDFYAMKMEGSYGSYNFENWRLARAMNHIALGKMPARTDTDFMSFGVWRLDDIALKINGNDFYGIEKVKIDLSEFHWMIPEVFDIKIDNINYDIEGVIAYIKSISESIATSSGVDQGMDDDQMKIMVDILGILKKYDLASPSFDLQVAGHWDAETGKSDFLYAFGLDKFSHFKAKMDFVYPDYGTVLEMLPEKIRDMDAEEWDSLIAVHTFFSQFALEIADEGGLEKGFAMAVDFAQLAPEDDPGMAMFRNSTPEILRNMASNGILVANAELSKSFPPAVDYVQALSKFIAEGGTFSIVAAPSTPIGAEEMESLEALGEADPESVVKLLGLSVTHVPPQ
jgi:hypothetical protein